MVKDYLDYPADYDLNRRYLDALRIENTGLGLLFMAKRATPLDMELVNQLEMPIFLCLAENDKVVKIDSEFSLELQENLPEQAVKLVMPGLNHLFIGKLGSNRQTSAHSRAQLKLNIKRLPGEPLLVCYRLPVIKSIVTARFHPACFQSKKGRIGHNVISCMVRQGVLSLIALSGHSAPLHRRFCTEQNGHSSC